MNTKCNNNRSREINISKREGEQSKLYKIQRHKRCACLIYFTQERCHVTQSFIPLLSGPTYRIISHTAWTKHIQTGDVILFLNQSVSVGINSEEVHIADTVPRRNTSVKQYYLQLMAQPYVYTRYMH